TGTMRFFSPVTAVSGLGRPPTGRKRRSESWVSSGDAAGGRAALRRGVSEAPWIHGGRGRFHATLRQPWERSAKRRSPSGSPFPVPGVRSVPRAPMGRAPRDDDVMDRARRGTAPTLGARVAPQLEHSERPAQDQGGGGPFG